MKRFKIVEEGRLNRNDLVNLKGGDSPCFSCDPIVDKKYVEKPCYLYTFCPKYTNCSSLNIYFVCGLWEDKKPCAKYK